MADYLNTLASDPNYGGDVGRMRRTGVPDPEILKLLMSQGAPPQPSARQGFPDRGLTTEDPLAPVPSNTPILQDPRYAADIAKARRQGMAWPDIEAMIKEATGRASVTNTRVPGNERRTEDMWQSVGERNRGIDKSLGALSKKLDDFMGENYPPEPAYSGAIPPATDMPPGPGPIANPMQDAAMASFIQAMNAGGSGTSQLAGQGPPPGGAPPGGAPAPLPPRPGMGPHPAFPGGIQTPPPAGRPMPTGAMPPMPPGIAPPMAAGSPGAPAASPGAPPAAPGAAGPGGMGDLFSNRNMMEFAARLMAGSGKRQNIFAGVGNAAMGTMQSHAGRKTAAGKKDFAERKHRDSMNIERRKLDQAAIKNQNDADIKKALIDIDQDNKRIDQRLKLLQIRSGALADVAGIREDYADRIMAASANLEGLKPEEVVRKIESLRNERDTVLQQTMDAAGVNFDVRKGGNNKAAPKTKAEYDALPSGTSYTAPDGSDRVKP